MTTKIFNDGAIPKDRILIEIALLMANGGNHFQSTMAERRFPMVLLPMSANSMNTVPMTTSG